MSKILLDRVSKIFKVILYYIALPCIFFGFIMAICYKTPGVSFASIIITLVILVMFIIVVFKRFPGVPDKEEEEAKTKAPPKPIKERVYLVKRWVQEIKPLIGTRYKDVSTKTENLLKDTETGIVYWWRIARGPAGDMFISCVDYVKHGGKL